MGVVKHCFVLFSALLVYVGASGVEDLTDQDFSSRITEYDTALVMFYAPW